jgi:hypothetical protein
MSVTPPCPECATETEPIVVEGEDVFRCPAPGCGRRTYGTDPEDDQDLPSYTETDEDGAVFVFHGTGEVDVEATAELAAPGGPDDEDQDPGPDAPAPAGWEPQVQDVRVKDLAAVLTGGWAWIYGDPEGWRFFTSAEYDADRGDTTVTITYSDGEVVREAPWPQARLVRAGSDAVPTATRPGPAGLVRR